MYSYLHGMYAEKLSWHFCDLEIRLSILLELLTLLFYMLHFLKLNAYFC